MEQAHPDGRRVLARRTLLALAGAGVAVATGVVSSAHAERVRKRFSHAGADVEISATGSGAEISVDGRAFEVVDSNGAYRAAGFMYSPQPTIEQLAKRLVESRRRIAGVL